MTVVALGLDLVDVRRLEQAISRRGARFLERVFTPAERAYCQRRARSAQSFAGRFAVKEAVMKALGTGWARGVRWIDIEVVRRTGEPPRVELHGAARGHADRRGIERLHVAITHDGGVAAAVVVAERAP